jgi:hypothetical protein
MQKCFRTSNTCHKFISYHNSGPHEYIHFQKALGYIHNYRILLTQANSSY